MTCPSASSKERRRRAGIDIASGGSLSSDDTGNMTSGEIHGGIELLTLLKEWVLLCGGAMGTMLCSKGIYLNSCFDGLNLSNPDLVRGIHEGCIRCDVDMIQTNTFGANRYKLNYFGLGDKVAEKDRAGARIAREADGADLLICPACGTGEGDSHAPYDSTTQLYSFSSTEVSGDRLWGGQAL
jgi:hypothetical protein